jgi:quinol-cytochrome oxidoreductase complex cytochrome b subunit
MGAKTLNRFFATHVLILPWVIALLAYSHFRLVRRHGLKEEE